MSNEMLHAALEYSKNGFSIIPIRGIAYTFGKDEKEKYDNAKLPLVKTWTEYQQKPPTEEEIQAWNQKWPKAGLAVITGKISGLTVLDLDSPEAIDFFLANHNPQTACADTPRGMHVFYAYEEGTRNTVKINGRDLDLRSEGGYIVVPPSVLAEGKQYKWIQNILEVPLSPLPDFLKECIKGSNNKDSFSLSYRTCKESVRGDLTEPYNSLHFLTQGTRDNDLFHIGNCLIKGGCEPDKALQVLEILANNCNPPFPEKEVHTKIKSVLDRCERRERNLTEDLKNWILLTSGYFSLREAYESLQILTNQKNTVHQIIHRLARDGFVERHSSTNGLYRLIEHNAEKIDWMNAPDKEFPIDLPLGLSREVILYPGNVVIFAGSKSSGKTALAFDIIKRNMNRHSVMYLNSEMHATEMKNRLSKHKDLSLTEWNFEALSVSHNWADYITKEKKLFVIDYIETANQDAWKVGGEIKAIHDRLGEGVAIIFLQKKAGEDLARGGQYTLDKARLYVAVDKGKAKIIDVKSFRGENPHGKTLDFKLIGGAKFLPRGDWREA